MSEEQVVTKDRKDLKIEALLQKISMLTTNYENQIADLRVDFTFSEDRVRQLEEQFADQIREEADETEETAGTE